MAKTRPGVRVTPADVSNAFSLLPSRNLWHSRPVQSIGVRPASRLRRQDWPVIVLASVGLLLGASRSAANPPITAAARRPVVIEGVAVVDVVRGELTKPQTIVLRDGRIVAQGEADSIAVPAEAERLDGTGQYLMPGLTDMHVHLFNNASGRSPNEWAFPLFVANGITAVREMACSPADLATIGRWRDAMQRGELVAPRIAAAGVRVRGGSRQEMRRQVRAARRAGADFVKVFSDLREAHWREALSAARKERMPVCGHVPADVPLLTGAKAGQRTSEHLLQVYEACSAREKELLATRRAGLSSADTVRLRDTQEREVLATFNPSACEHVARLLARTRQVQVPTLVLLHFESRGARSEFRDDPRWASLREDEQARWANVLESGEGQDADLAARRWEISREIVGALHKANVPILAGTDAPMPLVYPGSSLHTELQLLVEAGLTPAEALRTATVGPAEFLRRTDLDGTIAPGKRADLLLLDGNPLADVANTRRINAVVLDGRLLRRSDLDRLLAGSGTR